MRDIFSKNSLETHKNEAPGHAWKHDHSYWPLPSGMEESAPYFSECPYALMTKSRCSKKTMHSSHAVSIRCLALFLMRIPPGYQAPDRSLPLVPPIVFRIENMTSPCRRIPPPFFGTGSISRVLQLMVSSIPCNRGFHTRENCIRCRNTAGDDRRRESSRQKKPPAHVCGKSLYTCHQLLQGREAAFSNVSAARQRGNRQAGRECPAAVFW